MATFATLGTIAKQPDFLARVAQAMAIAAAAVYSESGTVAGHAARAAFATKVAAGDYNLQAVAVMVLGNSAIGAEADNTTAGNSIPDADIQFSVNSLWNVCAGA